MTEKLSSAKIQAEFLALFGFTLESKNTANRELQNRIVRRLRIHNDDEVLKTVFQNENVITTLEDWKFGFLSPVFMVVGLLIADEITYHETNSQEMQGSMQVDAAKIAASSSGVTLPISSQMGGSLKHTNKTDLHIKAKGQRVFAIEYRILRRDPSLNFRSKPSLDKVTLGAHGPQGDRTFEQRSHTGHSADSSAATAHFLKDSFDEFIEGDEQESYFSLE